MAALDKEGLGAKIEGYVAEVAGMYHRYCLMNGYDEDEKYEVEYGPKYVRVWKVGPGSKSIHTFINRENGDILKAAGWKGPAKNGVRGNVFNMNYGADCASWCGARYLK